MSEPLLTPKEAMQRLGLKKSTFHKYQSRGLFKCCLSPAPIGTRRYVASRIEAWRAGESPHWARRRQTA